MTTIPFKALIDAIDFEVVFEFEQLTEERSSLDPRAPDFDRRIASHADPVRALLAPLVDDLGCVTVDQLRRARDRYRVAVHAIEHALREHERRAGGSVGEEER
jgi:hypothetical protein